MKRTPEQRIKHATTRFRSTGPGGDRDYSDPSVRLAYVATILQLAHGDHGAPVEAMVRSVVARLLKIEGR